MGVEETTKLATIKEKQPECKYHDKNILIKPALSAAIRKRIWALNVAFDIVQKQAQSNGKSVVKKSDKDRAILVDGVIAFDQSMSSGLGSFSGSYSGLSLPGK